LKIINVHRNHMMIMENGQWKKIQKLWNCVETPYMKTLILVLKAHFDGFYLRPCMLCNKQFKTKQIMLAFCDKCLPTLKTGGVK